MCVCIVVIQVYMCVASTGPGVDQVYMYVSSTGIDVCC